MRLEDKIVAAPRKSGPRVENWRGFMLWSPRVVVVLLYVGIIRRHARVEAISQAVITGITTSATDLMIYIHMPITMIIAITRIRGWP